MKHLSRVTASLSDSHNRRGSTLLVVLALLGLLALLGFTFYTFAAQERAAAEFFASEAHVLGTSTQPDGIFEWPLRQLILGPDDSNVNSALWGGRFSLVPGMLGLDGIPFNGEGVNVAVNASGTPFVDMNFDGTPDNPAFLSNPVDAPMANNGTFWGAGKSRASLPAPDTDYSYPDINSVLLSYDGYAINSANATSRVFIPTLLRPQYLRSGGPTLTNWYNNPASVPASASFRPHPDHFYIDSTGTSTGTKRYVQTQAEATNLGLSGPFWFQPLDASGSPNGGDLGIWTHQPDTTLNLDVDTDGDGIRESILVDLGYPPFRRGDGKLVIPLFAVQVRDLNGLINLNTSTSKLTKNLVPPSLSTQEFGADLSGNPRYLSSSNQGLAASEINAAYGLTANPATTSAADLQQYRFFLKMLGADRNPMSVREAANIEWFFLTYGRPQFNVQYAQSAAANASAMAGTIETITPGLLGDVDTMLSVLLNSGVGTLPQAGVIGSNDNYDTANTTFPFFWTTASAIPQLGTPLDLFGNGSILAPNTSGGNPLGKKLNVIDRSTQPAIGPNRWLSFQGYHSNADVLLSTSPYAAQLLQTSNQLTDDSSEVIVDPDALALAAANYSPAPVVGGGPGARTVTGLAIDNDAVFGPLDTAFLQQSNGDGTVVRGTSRIANLIPLNSTSSPTAASVRSQYTTVSSDRREFSKFTTGQASPSAQMRAWESTFLNTTGSFRTAVLYLMSGQSTLKSKSFRLSANQLLVDSTDDPFSTAAATSLVFRDLTAHPSQTSGLPSSVVTSGSQEYKARRDRQAMARDIYVLLYLYGSGLDANPSTIPNNPPGQVTTAAGATPDKLYTAAQVKEMAQFAVNYVDALDRDSIMTRFEYDPDLSDGWGLDDDPYTNSAQDLSAGRKEVWGIESQQLTFAEALVVKTNKLTSDNSTTEWDDTVARYFAYTDLQSSSSLSTDFSNRAWQVRLLLSGTDTLVADERRITPRVGSVSPGGLFTILSAGDTSTKDSGGNLTSNFKVNSAVVIPQTPLPAQPNRLDLMVDPTTNFDLTDGTSPTPAAKSSRGDLLNGAPDPATVKLPVIFQLMRRADPFRSPPTSAAEEADNPWVEVDRIQTGTSPTTGPPATAGASGIKIFSLKNTDGAPEANTALKTLTSRYRAEPFAADFEQDFNSASTPANYSYNYIGNTNKYDTTTTPPTVQYSQFHFDRPFTSLAELLDIPVVGPGLYSKNDLWYDKDETLYLTKALGHANQSPYNQVNVVIAGAATPNRAMTAAAKFLMADFPDTINNSLTAPQQLQQDNRWYRLLEFLEVPSPMHRHPELHTYSINQATGLGLPINFGWPRVHGQLNLNAIRHSNVLAGLLDDNLALNVQAIAPNPPTQLASIPGRDATDTAAYGVRDWWFEFIRSRDGVINPLANPTTPNLPVADADTGLFIPGLPGTRPFRGFNYTSRGNASQKQDSMFRNLPADANASPADARSLFEIGQYAEHTGTSPALDSISKNRLLSKLMNNVTTRTNSYGVFIAVQYFEAAEDTSGSSTAIRIGGRLDDTPTQRAFFVVDRTGAVEQWKTVVSNGFAAPVSSNTYSITPNTAASGMPANGINWQQLVLYRQTLN